MVAHKTKPLVTMAPGSSTPKHSTLFPHLRQANNRIHHVSTKFGTRPTPPAKDNLRSSLPKGCPRWVYIKDVATANFKGKYGPPVFKVGVPQKLQHWVTPP